MSSSKRMRVAQAVAREAERNRRARERLQLAAARQAERALKERQRLEVQRAKADLQQHIEEEARRAEAATHQLQNEVACLQSLLSNGVRYAAPLDFEALKEKPTPPKFSAGPLAQPEPAPVVDAFLPAKPFLLLRLLPGAKAKYEARLASGWTAFERAKTEHAAREQARTAQLAIAQDEHARAVKQVQEDAARQHAEVDRFRASYQQGEKNAIEQYCSEILERSSYPSEYPEDFPKIFRIAYVPESKQAVIEYDFPTIDVVPDADAYAYIKARDEIVKKLRPERQRRELYASILAQVTLRTLYELFAADTGEHLETIVFNGYVETIDPATGATVRPCLISVRTTRGTLAALDLTRVDPLACLRGLKAAISRSPAELTAVRPLLEFSMVDPRFIEGTDVLSTLDQRPNLMELSPSEFEALISNLFESMGLQTRLTQASRDGGVDCVAYDPRPIFGGKVVIQAKRYKNTVGVSAVRDLFGTVQNEGASKGILVTTSGYGSASMEFAAGKPLELLDGSNLLYLLKEHAGIDAKIEIPEGWQDPSLQA